LTPQQLAETTERLIANGKLTQLGRQIFEDAREWLWVRDPPTVIFARSLAEARTEVGCLLGKTRGAIGYITGGLESGFHHILLNGLVSDGVGTFVIGLEEDKYIAEKGRTPLFTTQEKVSWWRYLAPEGSVIFVVPSRPEELPPDKYYDWLAEYIGLYRNVRAVYVGSVDDPAEVRAAHQ
jgi:hypothetical protein